MTVRLGRPLVVCHGSFTVSDDWVAVAKALSANYLIYLYDRRGRGASPDTGSPYTFYSEVEDLAAVAGLAGPDTSILGHSFGGATALMYALSSDFGGRLVLYEPTNSILRPLSGGPLPALRARLESGDLDSASCFALEFIAGLPGSAIPGLRQSPAWPALVSLCWTFLREAQALDSIAPSLAELAKLRARTWVLIGPETENHPHMSSAGALVERIRGLTVYPIPKQGHVAHWIDSDALARIVRRCLEED